MILKQQGTLQGCSEVPREYRQESTRGGTAFCRRLTVPLQFPFEAWLGGTGAGEDACSPSTLVALVRSVGMTLNIGEYRYLRKNNPQSDLALTPPDSVAILCVSVRSAERLLGSYV